MMDKPYGNLLDVENQYRGALDTLFSAFGHLSDTHAYKRNEIFLDFSREDEGALFLIESGMIGFYRNSDRLLIHETQAPAMLGLVHLFHKADIIAMAHSDLVLLRVPRESALQIVETQGLWREVALVLGQIVRGYVTRDLNLVAQDAYHIVKHHLQLLMAMSVEERYATTAVKFITSRTMLSRSRVMDILRQLNMGNYITIKNGILLKISTLPERF